MLKPPIPPTIWASSGSNILAPSAGKQAQGWVPGEQPPAGFFNWWQNAENSFSAYVDKQLLSLASERWRLNLGIQAELLSNCDGGVIPNWSGHWLTLSVNGSQTFVSGGNADPAIAAAGTPYSYATRQNFRGGIGDSFMWILFGGNTGTRKINFSGTTITEAGVAAGSTRVWHAAATSAPWMYGGNTITVYLSETQDFIGRQSGNIHSVSIIETAGTGNFAGAMQRAIVWDQVRLRFLVVFGNGNTMTSPDGVTWTAQGAHGLSGGGLLSIAYWPEQGAYVTCAKNSVGLWAVKYSLDGGATWVSAALLPFSSANVVEVFWAYGAIWMRGVDADLRWSLNLDRPDWVTQPVKQGASVEWPYRGAFRHVVAYDYNYNNTTPWSQFFWPINGSDYYVATPAYQMIPGLY